MRFSSLFSGIEAASVAWLPLGWECAWLAEVEPFPCAVLAHHYPDTPNLGDVTDEDFTAKAAALGPVDLVVGGAPCQSFSVAGLRKGLKDDRGNLTLRFLEVVNDLDPRWALFENVPGILSDKTNAFGCLLAGLVGENAALVPPGGRWTDAGLVVGPQRAVAWRVLDAQYFELAQRRRRVFVLAGRAGARPSPAEILFEPESLRRRTPPSRKAGENVAGTIESRAATGGYDPGAHGAAAGHLIAHTLTGPPSSARFDPNGETYVAHTLRGRGFNASEDGTGRGTPIVPCVAFNHQSGGDFRPMPRQDQANALQRHQGQAVALGGMAVRRLTPEECEKLQGFPVGYTRIPWRGKSPEDCPDSPRYRALGNSMAVTVMRWLGERIQKHVEGEK